MAKSAVRELILPQAAPAPKPVPGLVSGLNADHINAWVREVWNDVGDTTDYELFPTDLLIAYWNPKTVGTSGKLYAAPKTSNENRFQAKCGLILKAGPEAFKDGPGTSFFGFKATVGDWVVWDYEDGREIGLAKAGTIGSLIAKRLRDAEIKMKIPRPDRIW